MCKYDVEWTKLHAGDNNEAIREIAAASAHTMPRGGLGHDLRDRDRLVDAVGINHAIATIRNRIASLDPTGRRRQRQRRIGGYADQITGAERPSVDQGDILLRTRPDWYRFGGDATERLAQRQFGDGRGCKTVEEGGKSRIKRCKRRRQALSYVHGRFWITDCRAWQLRSWMQRIDRPVSSGDHTPQRLADGRHALSGA